MNISEIGKMLGRLGPTTGALEAGMSVRSPPAGRKRWRSLGLVAALGAALMASACTKSDGTSSSDIGSAVFRGFYPLAEIKPKTAGSTQNTHVGQSLNRAAQQSPSDIVFPFLVRQPDCSFSLHYSDLTGTLRAQTTNYQNVLLTLVGLTPSPNPFPQGCADNRRGVSAEQGLVLGVRTDGAYYGALVNSAGSGVIVTVASSSAIVVQNTITLTTGPTESVLRLAAGDFNGDGKPDLVATILGNTEILAVLLGNGDGTFAAPVRYPVTGLGFHVVVDDFNNDNRLDFATVTVTGVDLASFRTVVTVLPGNGDGSFGAPQVAATANGFGGGAFVSADFNGDGRRDIASASGLIFLGQANGTFTPGPGNPVSFGSSDLPAALAAGDFDGDGRSDLAVATTDGVVQLWRGNGDGRFTHLDIAYALFPTAFRSLAAIDIDGDGHLDLVAGLASGGGVGPNISSGGTTQFLFGLGNGHFASIPAYERASALLADFNGDGKLDLLGFGDANAGTPGFQPLLGAGDGSFTPGPLSPVGFTPSNSLGQRQGITYLAADLNNDRRVDVVAAGGSTFSARLGKGDGSFQAAGADLVLPYAGGSPLRGFVAADFNGDGKADIAGIGNVQVSNTTASGEVIVLDGKGDGSFQPLRAIDNGLLNPVGIVTADFNGDGHADLAVISRGVSFGASPQPGDVRLYRGNGDGSFQPALILNNTLYPSVIGVGDVNGDGRPDLIVVSVPPLSFDGTLEVYLANSNGTFTAVASRALPNSGATYTIAVGDIDGDGHADLVLGGCCNSGTTAVFAGNGDGTFGPEQSVGVGQSTQAAALGDLNGDGRLDVVAEQSFGVYADVFINKPETATPPPPATPTVTIAANPTTITLGASTTLTWSSTNAAACTASGAWTGAEAISGTQTVTPAATGSAAYTLSCTDGSTSVGGTATVTVNAVSPPPPPPPSPSPGGGGSGGVFAWPLVMGLGLLRLWRRRDGRRALPLRAR